MELGNERDAAFRNSHDQHEGFQGTPAQPITPVGTPFTQGITAEALDKAMPYLTGEAEEAARRQLDAYRGGRK